MSELIDYLKLEHAIRDAQFALEEIRDIIQTLPKLPRFADSLFELEHLARWVREADHARQQRALKAEHDQTSSFPRAQAKT